MQRASMCKKLRNLNTHIISAASVPHAIVERTMCNDLPMQALRVNVR